MKKILFCLAILLSLSSARLLAQNSDHIQQMQQMWRTYLKDTVQLSDVLTDSVMAVRTQYMPQMRDIFMDQSASQSDKQAKMQSLRTEMDVRYKAAGLTADQIQMIHMHEDMLRQQMMNKMNNGGQ